jgi:hypothetical protein
MKHLCSPSNLRIISKSLITETHHNGGMRIQHSSNNNVLKLITPHKIPLPQKYDGFLNFKF